MLNMHEISSPQNPRYKVWLKLLDGRGTKKYEQALVFGRRFIFEIATRFPERALGLILKRESDADGLMLPAGYPAYLLPADLFDQLDIYGIKAPILIVSAPPLPQWNGRLPEGLTVFVPFQNPINLGTTIRSAAALGASVVLLKEAATPYLPKSLRASGPAAFLIPLLHGPGLEELASAYAHLPIYALSPRGESIFSFKFADPMGLVAGLEGSGLDAYWPLVKRLSIPMSRQVESLNASVAISIAMSFHQAACPG